MLSITISAAFATTTYIHPMRNQNTGIKGVLNILHEFCGSSYEWSSDFNSFDKPSLVSVVKGIAGDTSKKKKSEKVVYTNEII